MDLIERLINLGYTYKEAEEFYLEYAQFDNLVELEAYILFLERENENV